MGNTTSTNGLQQGLQREFQQGLQNGANQMNGWVQSLFGQQTKQYQNPYMNPAYQNGPYPVNQTMGQNMPNQGMNQPQSGWMGTQPYMSGTQYGTLYADPNMPSICAMTSNQGQYYRIDLSNYLQISSPAGNQQMPGQMVYLNVLINGTPTQVQAMLGQQQGIFLIPRSSVAQNMLQRVCLPSGYTQIYYA
jgi:hypothetical protein